MKKISIIILLIISIAFPSVTDSKFNDNPVLSMGLSAIIPGAGQILNGDYKKGIFFFGIELLALNQKSNYNNNAKSFIEEYEDYALDYWSVEKWLKDFYLFKHEAEHVISNYSIYDTLNISNKIIIISSILFFFFHPFNRNKKIKN